MSSECGLKRYGAGALSLDYLATLICWKLGISLIHSAASFDVYFAGISVGFYREPGLTAPFSVWRGALVLAESW